ncbi:MAG: hypothetical protein A2X35_03750 [Elusimicrobia bacterium GWA2_61_42]|nr:MAG: hypothetical protein A2X35_03750 [Elusimicrobia bacterium GWA2_61_42]OGR77694.1 MAG: hypothetical protein A2X38_09990 [Elusimicrobia bacterium GWC2_61_25]
MPVKIKKELAFRRVGEELFVVDAAKARLHELNGSAALVWDGLAGGKSESAIAAALAEEFEVDRPTALADAKEFISELRAAGLVEEK